MGTFYHKTLEDTLNGFYEFGDHYYVVLGSKYVNSNYAAIHERTHVNLCSSTSFGLFQKFIQYLRYYSDFILKPSFVEAIFRCLFTHARDVHEATATYNEFCVASHHKDPVLEAMDKALPGDYRAWRRIFDDFFPSTIPAWARGNLAYHLARYALNTQILEDCSTLNDNIIHNFNAYLNLDANNPNMRLIRLLECIKRYGIDAYFEEYISFYFNIQNELHVAYQSRTIDNRKKTYAIQRQFMEIMDKAVLKLSPYDPIFQASCITDRSIVTKVNSLIANWCHSLVTSGYSTKLSFRIANTEDDEVDMLDSTLTPISERQPQHGLVHFNDASFLLKDTKCFVRVWIWKYDRLLQLSTNPPRFLKKGDYYIRMFPENENLPILFLITSNFSEVLDILNAYASVILIDGDDLLFAKDHKVDMLKLCPILVHWSSAENFTQHNSGNPRYKIAGINLSSAGVSLVLGTADNHLYNLFKVPNSDSLDIIIEALVGGEDLAQTFTIPNTFLSFPIQILNANFSQLL